jgi:hypothetical protein
VSALVLLMGLLVLSYIGSFLVSGRAVRGLGLPSGVEYVALGFVIGPQVLGIMESSMLDSFEPIAQVALGWLALVFGLDFGFAADRRVRSGSLILGIVSSLLSGGAAAGAVYLFLQRFPIVPPGLDRGLLVGGVGAACAETTRHTVRWVTEKHNASGRLSNLLTEVSHADDAVPLLALALLFAVPAKPAHVPWHVPVTAWLGLTIAFGLVLGAVAALLVGREFSLHHAWGVLFGTSLLAIGVAARLEIAIPAVTFFMGIAMSAVSPHRQALRETVAPTEQPVLLPALVLAGARLQLHTFQTSRALVALVAVALGARVVGKLVSGIVLRVFAGSARPASPLIGFGLLSSGVLSMTIGLAFALRFPGAIGDTVLAAAVAGAIFGEFVAPAALRRVLTRAGEVPDPSPPSERKPEPKEVTTP